MNKFATEGRIRMDWPEWLMTQVDLIPSKTHHHLQTEPAYYKHWYNQLEGLARQLSVQVATEQRRNISSR